MSKKEIVLNVGKRSIHFYRASGFSVIRRQIDIYENNGDELLSYSIYFVLNAFGLGVAISDYCQKLIK